MTPEAADAHLRRFERDAVAACLAMAVLAALLTAGRGAWPALRAAAGVLGGGVLTAFSYRAIKAAAGVVTRAADAAPARLSLARKALLAVKFFTRYALLAVGAYVMLTCLSLHPVSVLAGATSPFLAALMQVGRMSRARARRQHP